MHHTVYKNQKQKNGTRENSSKVLPMSTLLKQTKQQTKAPLDCKIWREMWIKRTSEVATSRDKKRDARLFTDMKEDVVGMHCTTPQINSPITVFKERKAWLIYGEISRQPTHPSLL